MTFTRLRAVWNVAIRPRLCYVLALIAALGVGASPIRVLSAQTVRRAGTDAATHTIKRVNTERYEFTEMGCRGWKAHDFRRGM